MSVRLNQQYLRPHPDSPTERLEVCELGPPFLLCLCGSWLWDWSGPGSKTHSCRWSLWVHLSKVCNPASAWIWTHHKHSTCVNNSKPVLALMYRPITTIHYTLTHLTLCRLCLALVWERIHVFFGLFFLWVWVRYSVRGLSARSCCPITGLACCGALGGPWSTKPWKS